MSLLLAELEGERQHRQRLRHLLDGTNTLVRIASAYVTDQELLLQPTNQEIRLVTSLSLMDIASGATKVEALRAFIESGVLCRRVAKGDARMHAKVYIFGTSTAVVTSANLTRNALNSNIEVGVEITGENVQALTEWYDRLWELSHPFSIAELIDLQEQSAQLRREYAKFKKELRSKVKLPAYQPTTGKIPHNDLDLLDKAKQFFVCNTDRVEGGKTQTGGYNLEQEMRNRRYAAAWVPFRYLDHMKEVKPGDAIFMYAKGIGIIGIGHAIAECQTLAPGNPDRIRNTETNEWRVPVQWLVWDDQDAYGDWNSPPPTFWNISDDGYADLREGVREHFFGI